LLVHLASAAFASGNRSFLDTPASGFLGFAFRAPFVALGFDFVDPVANLPKRLFGLHLSGFEGPELFLDGSLLRRGRASFSPF
jgi:hypothetical protein